MADNPQRFIFRDGSLVPMFDLLRSSGKRVFLVTNSLWDYTNVVMNWLCEGRVGAERNLDWLRHFDLVRARAMHAEQDTVQSTAAQGLAAACGDSYVV